MGLGNIKFNIYYDNIGQPASGVDIEISGNNKIIKLKTDSSGQASIVGLDCPNEKFSLQPQLEVCPYAVYDVRVLKRGMETKVIEGIEIFDNVTSLQELILNSDDEEKSSKGYSIIGEHCLWGNYDPKVIVDPFTMQVMGINDAILDSDKVSEKISEIEASALIEPIVPEYVIVHDGLPTNRQAASYYVPFPEYIKNVATSEIYSTWPEETLKANIYAIISFTLSRYYSEWYRSKGYQFTITTSTGIVKKW